jgi:hypothetical protein
MDFLKRHYEKILLGVVLLGLAAAVALLYFKIEGEKETLRDQADVLKANPKELPPVDLSHGEETLKRLAAKVSLDLSPPHNVVNPVPWVQSPGGQPKKLEEGGAVGPAAVKVVKIDPLYLILTYNGTNAAGYEISIERQAATRPSERARTSRNVNLNDPANSTTLFSLRNVKTDAAGNPIELDLEMVRDKKQIKLTPPNPYREVAGYKATLRYPPENNREFRDQYRDSEILLEGERYIVLSLSETEVVLSAKSNGKRTTVRLESGSPAQ